MMLAAGLGSTIEIVADGPEAKPALDALVELVQGRFDEDQ
jgi:phosphocarrier protein